MTELDITQITLAGIFGFRDGYEREICDNPYEAEKRERHLAYEIGYMQGVLTRAIKQEEVNEKQLKLNL